MAGGLHGRSTDVVGRDDELDRLERALRSARAGRGRGVFVVGEAGIGKTAVGQEAARVAHDLGMRVLRGRGSSIGPLVPFRPLTELLMTLARSGPLPEDAELQSYRSVLGRLVPDWALPGTAVGATSLVVLAEAVLRLLGAVGRRTGCLVLLDDLQDADPETLAVLDYLTDNLAGVPVAVVATVRDEPSDALEMARAAVRRGSADIVELDRLDRAGIAALAAQRLECEVDELPGALAEELQDRSAGVPLAVEELLHDLLGNGLLHRGDDGWRMTESLRGQLPESLLRSVLERADRLGEAGRSLLTVAAVLGVRFPLTVVQDVTGLGDREFLGYLRMATRLQLVVPDETSPDWYGFRHPLVAESLLADTTPARLAGHSARIADAVELRYPGLPGAWCPQTAALRLAAGEPAAAGVLFARAGERALENGAASSAVALLERAEQLLTGPAERERRWAVLGSLVPALAGVGRLDNAVRLVGAVGPVAPGDEATTLAGLHTQLARSACTAGLWAEAARQLAAARALLGSSPSAPHLAAVDVVAATAALGSPGPSGVDLERLARGAVEVAEAAALPVIAVDGWQVLGLAAQGRDVAESRACYRRGLRLAEQHRLHAQRVYLLVRLANLRWVIDGDVEELRLARSEAERLGMVVLGLDVQANLAAHALLSGDFGHAEELVQHCLPTAARLRLDVTHRYLLATLAGVHAHRGRRALMEQVLAELTALGPDSRELLLAGGLARAFCALVEGDVVRARADLAGTAERESAIQGAYQLSGTHGLGVLLQALDTPAAPPDTTVTGARRWRWNRHFVELAAAVTLGRAGRTDEAAAAFAAAQETGRVHPTALHLGRWLVADEALAGGWADGVALLRSAEQYFHSIGGDGVAAAARGRLRSAGAPVRQRRAGVDRVPGPLRTLGVTGREFEVLELLVERISNKEIAARLHISHRTVEKHVANLITKTQLTDRATLRTRAVQLLGEPAPGPALPPPRRPADPLRRGPAEPR
jgi:DNA-binding CsgD family transcriptional regulator